jgi:hypothetical protein
MILMRFRSWYKEFFDLTLYHDLNGIKIIETVCSDQPVLFYEHWNSLLRGGYFNLEPFRFCSDGGIFGEKGTRLKILEEQLLGTVSR